jgi:hypothetical protein
MGKDQQLYFKMDFMKTRSFKLTHKFKAKPVKDDSHHFPSQLEWKFYQHLLLLQKSNLVLFFLRQVPFHLPGGVKYIVDYQVFNTDGTVQFIDVKGVETSEFILKKKLVEETYPIEIKVIKRGDF